MPEKSPDNREKGIQPLDSLLKELKLENHHLVEKSSEQLTHKMVAKGRKGRRLTVNVQMKILNALNTCQDQKTYRLTDLFNY